MGARHQPAPADDGPFEPLVAPTLTAEAIDALLERRAAYVHVPAFLHPEWCAEVVRRFGRAMDALASHRSMQMGPMVFDALARPVEMFYGAEDPDAYFRSAAEDAGRVRALFEGGADPLELVRAAFREAGHAEVPAQEDPRRRYLTDVVWGIERAVAPPHVDAYERESDTALSRFERRFNFNVYLQLPDSGGAFVAYDRFATDAPLGVKPWLDPEGARALFAATRRVTHHPAPGDLVMLDAMRFHEVTQIDGATQRRVQLHSCVLVDPVAREHAFFV